MLDSASRLVFDVVPSYTRGKRKPDVGIDADELDILHRRQHVCIS